MEQTSKEGIKNNYYDERGSERLGRGGKEKKMAGWLKERENVRATM